MFKDKKAVIKNTICYFIPFVFMTIIAVVFLRRTFSLLAEQNISIMQVQVQNILADIEEDISDSRQIADEMCIDSALSRENMLEYGKLTLAGMRKIEQYGQRMQMFPTIFLTYTDKQIVTKNGTMKGRVFAEELSLTEESLVKYQELMQGTERFQSCVLEKENGGKYLFLLYYYPQSKHIDEKRIGYIFDAIYIEDILEETAEPLNGTLVLVWEDELLAECIYKSSEKIDAEFEDNLDDILNEKEKSEYTSVLCEGKYFDVQMHVLLDNRILSGQLTKEAIKMIVMGSICFIFLSVFLWLYGKYRYQLLYELRQLAEGSYLKRSEKSDFEVIRTVLQNNFDKISKQNEDLELFRKEAKRQLSWLLLNSAPPEDINITELMDNYGMTNDDSYYGVLEFLIENKKIEDDLDFEDIPEILVHCVARIAEKNVYVVGITLPTRDSEHKSRVRLVQTIKQRLKEEGYFCSCVSCGLIYEQITQMYCSQEEAFSVLQTVAYSEKRKEVVFFDEFAHISKKVPHIISELIEEFRIYTQQQNTADMLGVLKRLIAVPRDMDEDLCIYIRYKIIRILVEFIDDEHLSVEKMNLLMSFIELNDVEFGDAVKGFIYSNLAQDKKRRPQGEQILAYIQEQFCNPELSLVTVSEYFEVSERSINRILKNSIGKTYKEYLDYLRLQKACTLLVNTDKDIKDIVKLVGYFDVSSFIRLFKQNYGMTPSEYRLAGMAPDIKKEGER